MSGSGQVTLGRQQDVDDLAVLVDGPVEISPCASDLHIGLVDERPVTGAWRHGRAASMNSRGESLNPPVDGDVIHGDATLSQQLFDVAVRQSVPQVPPDREGDHLPREPEASEDRGRTTCSHSPSLRPSAINQRNQNAACRG